MDIGTQSHTQMMTQRDPSVQGHRYIHRYAATQPHSSIRLPMLNHVHRQIDWRGSSMVSGIGVSLGLSPSSVEYCCLTLGQSADFMEPQFPHL